MKQYKIDVLKKIEEASEDKIIISLREQANACGIKHLKTQECLEIANKFLKNHPDYKMVRMMETPYDGIFCSLNFVDKEVQFDALDYEQDCEEA
ncbi:MAG TPA: hypothetical protein OIL97_04710 [Oscillospiraceae bacterium]|jgi:hypothetical protein|nr:hypothetical protein [Oscillospiraceae bacterium]